MRVEKMKIQNLHGGQTMIPYSANNIFGGAWLKIITPFYQFGSAIGWKWTNLKRWLWCCDLYAVQKVHLFSEKILIIQFQVEVVSASGNLLQKQRIE